jgi:O-antigen ligase
VLAHICAWLFVFTVPWQNMLVIPGFGTIAAILGAVAIGATMVHVVVRGRVRPLISFHWFAIAFFVWIMLSTYWAIAFHRSMVKDLNTYMQVFVMLWILWEAAPNRQRLISLLQAYVLGAYVASGSTIVNYLSGVGFQEDAKRYSATGFDPNDLGALLALALPMAWYCASAAAKPLQRLLNRFYFIVGTVGILLTGSRGALLATIAGLAVIPWTLTHLRRGIRVAAVIIIIGAGATAAWMVPENAFQRLSTTGSEISEGTLNNRLRIWKAGLMAVPGRPFQGYGPAGWYPAVGLQAGNVAPHSTWLGLLVEEGLIGLALYLSLYAILLKRLTRLPTFERRVGIVLLGTLAVAVTPLGWHQNKASWLVLALLAAWSQVFRPDPAAWSQEPLPPWQDRVRRPLSVR